LITRKAYDLLIKALAVAHKQGLDLGLVLIGEGPERKNLERIASESGLTDRVLFAGSVSDEMKFKYLSAADIYALPSLHEGFGIVLLEAMTCSLPIIATNKGGQTDIVKDGYNGILIPPSDEKALADAITTLASDAQKRNTIGKNNKEDVKNYSMSAVAGRYLELFNKVIRDQ
jgi:glycosyltransferase involved in cell wall biosynthesis